MKKQDKTVEFETNLSGGIGCFFILIGIAILILVLRHSYKIIEILEKLVK